MPINGAPVSVHTSDDCAHPPGAGDATAALLSSAERLRLLESAVINSYDSIVITDAGSPACPRPRIILVNAAFTRLSGYSSEEAIGRSPSLLQGPESDRNEIGRMRVAMACGEVFTSELINYRKDGTPFHVEARVMPIRDARGRVTHWIGVQRDITARKQATAERERLEARLREKQKLESLGVLAGGVAHDFNNLLTIIMGNASLARLDLNRPEGIAHNLQFIESAAQRAADLCRQMLAYSGKGRFFVRAVDLNAVLRETADLVRSTAGHHHHLQLELGPDLAPIRADSSQLQQIVMNLLINATEAAEPTGGVIRVTTANAQLDPVRLARAHLGPELPAAHYVVLEVADNGCGISRDLQERIFDPFFTTKFTGRGLGLAAVLGIVRAHDGAIEVESEPGRGAVFRVFLPASNEPVRATPPITPRRLAGRGRTVLVADDERLLRETLRDLLGHLGFEVITAADGAEAVALFHQHRDRLAAVLLDLTMPNIDGVAAFSAIHSLAPGLPVVLMTGYNREEALERFAEHGLAGFLQKPFAAEDLLETLAATLPT
ncbi:MAG: response regulator [Opitutaceae bacterium]|nr:response regulator [Opitutaceae bacterium]